MIIIGSLSNCKYQTLLWTVTFARLVNKCPVYMEFGGSFPCSQDPATESLPEPFDSDPHAHTVFILTLF
jgi:hypothetical protein